MIQITKVKECSVDAVQDNLKYMIDIELTRDVAGEYE